MNTKIVLIIKRCGLCLSVPVQKHTFSHGKHKTFSHRNSSDKSCKGQNMTKGPFHWGINWGINGGIK